MRTRRWMLLALLATVVAVPTGWLLWPPRPSAITWENFHRLNKTGMTLAEVEAILGGPARDVAETHLEE